MTSAAHECCEIGLVGPESIGTELNTSRAHHMGQGEIVLCETFVSIVHTGLDIK